MLTWKLDVNDWYAQLWISDKNVENKVTGYQGYSVVSLLMHL